MLAMPSPSDSQSKLDNSIPTVQIVGNVLDKDGHPITGATIKFFAYAGSTGAMPRGLSNSVGYFSLRVPALGAGLIRAMKIDSGYPDAGNTLYGRIGYESVKEISANADTPLIEVSLRFGDPDAVIDWTIRSEKDSSILKNALYKIALVEDPAGYSSGTIRTNGGFLFVLPKRPVVIVISAPGYMDWSTADDPAFGRNFMLKPGSRQKRDIYLKASQ